MHASSRSIVTNQSGPHEDLSRRVARALAHPLRKPVADHTRTAFEAASEWLEARPGMPLVLDAGCGVGLSTRRLAVCFPDHAVIGVDRSESRLSREHGPLPANALLVRADRVALGRLARAAGWRPARHAMPAPSPSPTAAELRMRSQGHPGLAVTLALGGRREVSSNWRLYVEECGPASGQATGRAAAMEARAPGGEFLTA